MEELIPKKVRCVAQYAILMLTGFCFFEIISSLEGNLVLYADNLIFVKYVYRN